MTATLPYANVRRDEFLRLFLRGMPSLDDWENVQAAYAFSKGAHRNQMRDDGTTRYFEHCKSVAWILGNELSITDDWQLIVIALLHDSKEDSFLLSDKRLELNFGPLVRQAIDDLSKRPGEDHAAYLARMAEPGVDWRVVMVKLADRLHNLRTIGSCSLEKQERKKAETRELYLPFMSRYQDEPWRASGQYIGFLGWLRRSIALACDAPVY